jgi:hypothetical protein
MLCEYDISFLSNPITHWWFVLMKLQCRPRTYVVSCPEGLQAEQQSAVLASGTPVSTATDQRTANSNGPRFLSCCL